MTEATVAGSPGTTQRNGKRVFSPRLSVFLEQMQEGATPNSGSFCSFCYNPLPPGFERCDHCGQSLAGRAPIESLPTDIIEMHRRMLKRESLIVNAFAYFGLALGVALFLLMVAINVMWMHKALWFFIFATLVLMVGTRVLAGIVGGVIGDELAYRYANKQLAEDWAQHFAQRETVRQD